jgi:Holliday junction resolvase RusA-like endonuclease
MIHLHIPSVPLSVNHLYVRTKGGGRALSAAGKKYKAETKTHLTRTYPNELRQLKTNVPWMLFAHMTFADESLLLNKGYPTSTENRYKKFDVSNRVKLLEDALAEATAVDDSHHWTVIARKSVGKEDSTHLWLWNLNDESNNAITNYLDTLLSIVEDE